MSPASEPSQSSPRMRWFQFDLRLLFVIITAVGVILALEMARRSDAEKAKGLTNTIRAGEQVVLSEYPQGFEIKRQEGVHSHTVTEVGKDYIRLRSIDGPESVIPLDKIYRIVDDPRPYGAAPATGGAMGGMPQAGAARGGFGAGPAAGFGTQPGGMDPGALVPPGGAGIPSSSGKRRSNNSPASGGMTNLGGAGLLAPAGGKLPVATKRAPAGLGAPAAKLPDASIAPAKAGSEGGEP